MPFVRLETSLSPTPDVLRAIQGELRTIVHEVKGDPAVNIAVAVHPNLALSFGGSDKPAAIVNVQTLEMGPDITRGITARVSQLLERHGVDPSRCYIFFHEVPAPHLVGWHGFIASDALAMSDPVAAKGLMTQERRVHASGSLRGRDGRPLPDIAIELWEREPSGAGTVLAYGVTDTSGGFDLAWHLQPARFGDLPDLRLVVLEVGPVLHGTLTRVVAEIVDAPENAAMEGYDFGNVEVGWYEYHPDFRFAYADYATVRLAFQGGGAATFRQSGGATERIARPIAERLRAGSRISVAEIQDAFDKAFPDVAARRDPQRDGSRHLADRLLNGFGPQLFRHHRDAKDDRLLFAYDWGAYQHDPSYDLPDYQVELRRDPEGQYDVVEVRLRFRLPGQLQPGGATTAWETFGPSDPLWTSALRVVRGAHFNTPCQVKGHVAQAHFTLEQHAVAFFRNIRTSPLRDLLIPHLREVIQINTNGQRTLLDARTGALPGNQPLPITEVVRWTESTIGEADWLGFRPRRSLGAAHRYAEAANQYWDLLVDYVQQYVRTNAGAIRTTWAEVQGLSRDLVEHAVPRTGEPLEAPLSDPAWRWYDANERPVALGGRAVSAVCSHDGRPTDADLDKLAQWCTYVIYVSTFFHSWFHAEMMVDLGELAHSAVLRAGTGVSGALTAAALPEAATALRTLSTLHTIDGFRYGFLLADEDGELPSLKDRIKEASRSPAPLATHVEQLRSRMNS